MRSPIWRVGADIMMTARSHSESALSFMKTHGAPYMGTHDPRDDLPDV